MQRRSQPALSRRERQIMDVLYSRGSATAAEVLEQLPDPPAYSTVRALLRVLEDKGHVRHRQDGLRYVFSPKTPRDRARRSALRHLVETFFDNSTEQAVAALLDEPDVTREELERLGQLIEAAKKEGR